MSDRLDQGEKSDESSTNLDAYYSCDDCGQGFKSRRELKEHESSQH
jgi:C2H2 type zinc finger protein